MKRILFIWEVIKRTSKRHWIFTIVGLLWIISPFDDILLPVVDEVILVLIWAWHAFQESKRPKQTNLPKQLSTK